MSTLRYTALEYLYKRVVTRKNSTLSSMGSHFLPPPTTSYTGSMRCAMIKSHQYA